MNTQVKLNKIFEKIVKVPNLESSLLGIGTLSYVWYRFRYFILSSFLFYITFFIKMFFLGEAYTSFYTAKILVFEQFVFWFAQIFWYLIILMQKEKESLQRLNFRLDLKISIGYSILVSLGIGYFLYQSGLMVYERLTIYSAVSFVFLAQIFIAIHLKYLHSHVYAHKRVFINMPLVIMTHFGLLILQIVLWNRYMFWSVPIVFGTQVAINALIKFYYYKREYDEKLIQKNENRGLENLAQIIISKNVVISCFMLLPEIFYFIMLHFNYINKVNYSILIFLLSALMNSRLPGLMLQDFLKYDSDKYNSLITEHMKKLILPLLITIFLLFLQSGLMNYFINGAFDVKIIFFSFLMSGLLAFCNLISNYFYSKKQPWLIILTTVTACIFIGISMSLFLSHHLIFSFTTAVLGMSGAIFIIFKLQNYSHLFLSNVVYLKKSFIYLVKSKNYNFIYEINLDQFKYYHPKISRVLDLSIKNNDPIFIHAPDKIFLARTNNEISSELMFYCKSIRKYTNVDLIPFSDPDQNFKNEIKQFKNLNPYNLKVLFKGLVKGHANYKKRLIK